MSADILPLAQDGVRLLLHAFAVFAGYLVIERMLFLFDRSSRPVDRMDLDVWLRSLGNRGMTALDEMPSSGEDWLSARLTTDVPDEDGIVEPSCWEVLWRGTKVCSLVTRDCCPVIVRITYR